MTRQRTHVETNKTSYQLFPVVLSIKDSELVDAARNPRALRGRRSRNATTNIAPSISQQPTCLKHHATDRLASPTLYCPSAVDYRVKKVQRLASTNGDLHSIRALMYTRVSYKPAEANLIDQICGKVKAFNVFWKQDNP